MGQQSLDGLRKMSDLRSIHFRTKLYFLLDLHALGRKILNYNLICPLIQLNQVRLKLIFSKRHNRGGEPIGLINDGDR